MISALDAHTQWSQIYDSERARLVDALGHVVDRGVIEGIAHIGSTSVPLWDTAACVDVGLAIWPYPISHETYRALQTLGYQPVGDNWNDLETRLLHNSNRFQLWISAAGGMIWHNHILLRNYLRADIAARRRASELRGQDTNKQQMARLLAQAHEWWIADAKFKPIYAVKETLVGFRPEWYISSGWAIDLFLGRVTRYHHDVDVVVPRNAQLGLQRYLAQHGWSWVRPHDGQLKPWHPNEWIKLPDHQAHAHYQGEMIDFLFTEFRDERWIYRRDPNIARASDRTSLLTADGIRYLAPELVLLFKSKTSGSHARPQDEADFACVAPHLDSERRAWLRWALTKTDPSHPWLARL